MTVLHEVHDFSDDLYPPVLARAEGMRSPRYCQLDPDYVTGKEGTARKINKIIRPGYFAGTIPGSNKKRILPRSCVAADLAASSTSLVVKDASIFVTDDVLSILAPYVRLTISSSSGGWVAGDTITVAMNSVNAVYTVVSGDIGGTLAATNSNLAAKVAATLNAHSFLGKRVRALAQAAVVTVYALDFDSQLSVGVSDTAANGSVATSGSLLALGADIGTVSAVNAETNTLTISAAGFAVPNGMPIGVANSSPVDGGMLSPNQAIDLLFRESQNYALFTSASVYRKRLPYWDGELAALFPEITLV